MEYCTSSCPQCGGMGEIPNGTYAIKEGVLSLISGFPGSKELFSRYSEILNNVRKQGRNPEKAVQYVKSKDRNLGAIVDKLPKSNRDFYFWLPILIMLIQLAYQVVKDYTTPSPISLEQWSNLFNQAIERTLKSFQEQRTPKAPSFSAPKFPSPPRGLWQTPGPKFLEPYKADPKPGRNDPCTCGSGKKSKKCCWT